MYWHLVYILSALISNQLNYGKIQVYLADKYNAYNDNFFLYFLSIFVQQQRSLHRRWTTKLQLSINFTCYWPSFSKIYLQYFTFFIANTEKIFMFIERQYHRYYHNSLHSYTICDNVDRSSQFSDLLLLSKEKTGASTNFQNQSRQFFTEHYIIAIKYADSFTLFASL